jgi:hypothetical protein
MTNVRDILSLEMLHLSQCCQIGCLKFIVKWTNLPVLLAASVMFVTQQSYQSVEIGRRSDHRQANFFCCR